MYSTSIITTDFTLKLKVLFIIVFFAKNSTLKMLSIYHI